MRSLVSPAQWIVLVALSLSAPLATAARPGIYCVVSVLQEEALDPSTDPIVRIVTREPLARGQVFRSPYLDNMLAQMHVMARRERAERDLPDAPLLPPSPPDRRRAYLVLQVSGSRALITGLTLGKPPLRPEGKQYQLEYVLNVELVPIHGSGPTDIAPEGSLEYELAVPARAIARGLESYPEPVPVGTDRRGDNNPLGIERLRRNDVIYCPQEEGYLPHNPGVVLSVDDDAGKVTVLRLMSIDDDKATFDPTPIDVFWAPNADHATKIANLGRYPQTIRAIRWTPRPRGGQAPR